ncbi:YjbE family putative metal transport protein [Heliobacillus mobilis]|uniref:YjbE family putative metal transport protein n=1 Tax=Heliobacterium mobile TaxID=28064 RepID=A0A6I3SGV0_HELMO|nr:TerC family protein [Heliobacterium mobile]MTV48071.1 YjbE family putative metal transport protein [Heliobacterium mobile]
MDLSVVTGIINIIIINLVLSGDNAVVIAMASMALPKDLQKKAIFWGATLAVVLRIILTFLAAQLLKIPLIQLIGGLLLAWIALKLLYPEKEQDVAENASTDFRKVILTILWADLLMSLDNVLAVAGASQGNIYLLIFGLAFSIPIVLVGSSVLTNLLARYPWLVYVGSGILAWTAGKMIIEDNAVSPFLHRIPYGELIVPIVITAAVVLIGKRTRDMALAER